MGFVKAKRERVYVKIALMAPSGHGKTYSALRLASSMVQETETKTGEHSRIVMINTEPKRSICYTNEPDCDIVDPDQQHSSEKSAELESPNANSPEVRRI